jgi:catechol 2,3-dioxygenase-like lactoylglutathione lyase family enzyme
LGQFPVAGGRFSFVRSRFPVEYDYREMYFTAIDHVQLAMPAGEEDSARAFYCDLLGMTELPKPVELAKRGGCWFASGAVQIHLGVEKDFHPAKKAHPALRCRDYSALLGKLRSAGAEVLADDNNPGVMRCYVQDPFGNRIELIRDSAAHCS